MSYQSTHREKLMAALSAAEQLVAESPHEPYGVHVTGAVPRFGGEVGVDLHFGADPEGVTALSVFGGVVAERDGTTRDGERFHETTCLGRFAEVPFWAWTRTEVEEAESEQGPVAA